MIPSPVSNNLTLVHSSIRGELYLEALRLQNEGKSVLKLNTGNPAAFGFAMPESVKEALILGMERATGYSDLRGMDECREAILSYHRSKGIRNLNPDDIFLSNGVSEMIQMVTLAGLNRGDEILLPTPNYPLWENCSRIAGATPVFYQCREENQWCPDPEDVKKKITPRTRAILLIHPNNPTGAVYPRSLLEEIVAIARRHDLIVLSDEIYDRLLLEEKESFCSVASLCPDLVAVTLNGLSKSHVVCGIRCGWGAVSGPKKKTAFIREGLVRLCSMRLCANTAAQLMVPAALKDRAFTRSLFQAGGRLYESCRITWDVLAQIPGVSFVKNKAAFYLFPKLDRKRFHITSDQVFAMDLLHAKNLLIVPSSGFGWTGNDHFRIVMLPKKEEMKKAMEDLGDFLSDYRQDEGPGAQILV